MKDFVGKNILITTTAWFYAPDGKQYRAVWGELKEIHEAGKSLGFVPNRAHANWFFEIGKMFVTGCQVQYIIQCDEKPNTERVVDWQTGEGYKEFDRPTAICSAD